MTKLMMAAAATAMLAALVAGQWDAHPELRCGGDQPGRDPFGPG